MWKKLKRIKIDPITKFQIEILFFIFLPWIMFTGIVLLFELLKLWE